MDTPERKVWGERRLKGRGTLQIILVFTLTRPKTFTQGHVSILDKYLCCPLCKCKKFGHVSVNDLHLHWIYMSCIYGY